MAYFSGLLIYGWLVDDALEDFNDSSTNILLIGILAFVVGIIIFIAIVKIVLWITDVTGLSSSSPSRYDDYDDGYRSRRY